MFDRDKALFELKTIEYKIGKPLTDEQRELALDFTTDTIAFANPGTGKTHTLTAGIILAQIFHKIPADEIFCMSYTKAATDEIKARYRKLAKKMNASDKCNFGTFHKLSRKILTSAYPDIQVVGDYDYDDAIDDMTKYLHEVVPEYSFDKKKVWRIIKAIDTLNSCFVFDRENLLTKHTFKSLGLSVDAFQRLRTLWFERGTISGEITQGDIPLYCLYALIKKPDIIKEWAGKYKIMIVDEFQDLSLLHLEILSRVADTLVVVGDMKQQIYVYNGSCPEIVDAYYKSRPNARRCNLTQSFRCTQAIADLASNVIKPNLSEDAGFKGRVGTETVLSEQCIDYIDRRNIDWEDVFKDVTNETLNDIMILYRNNASTIPIIDELYDKKIPYRCTKFVKVTDIPVLSTLCDLVNAAWVPTDVTYARKALEHFPEFRYQKYNIGEYIKCMKNGRTSIYGLYNQLEQDSSRTILDAIKQAGERIKAQKSAGNVIASLRTVYDKYMKANEYYPNEDTYYYNMAAGICNRMTYPEMVQREIDKENRSKECLNADFGIRCYTMHSSKGLEAKHIYLLDVDEGLFPNTSVLTKKHEAGCDYDASLDVRSERNLLYVAITRAKDTVTISYSNGSLATLLSNPEGNTYRMYDKIYESEHKLYDDIETFKGLFTKGNSNE